MYTKASNVVVAVNGDLENTLLIENTPLRGLVATNIYDGVAKIEHLKSGEYIFVTAGDKKMLAGRSIECKSVTFIPKPARWIGRRPDGP